MSVSQVLHGVLMEQFKSGPPAWVKRRERPAQGGKSSGQDSDGRISVPASAQRGLPGLGPPAAAEMRRSAA